MIQELLDEKGLEERLAAMTDSVAAMVGDPANAALIGIRTRGAVLAERLQERVARKNGWNLPLGILDITLYRDDLSQLASHPLVRKTQLEFDVTGKLILLIDDVLYTGRTIRSAIDEIVDFGRPQAIRLAVLVDRGGRELPIQADYAALRHAAGADEQVKVNLMEIDGEERVIIAPRPPARS